MREHMKTERLLLRPFHPADSEPVQTLCANWKVARMTTRIAHPYPEGAAALWIASHGEAGARDEEHTLCIVRGGQPIGAVGLRKTVDRVYELGYWIGEPWWGRGYATEATARLLRFAFRELGAARLTSGHFLDNPASGRVLEKCGFAYTGEDREWSEARGEEVAVRRFELNRGAVRELDAAS